MYSDCRYEFLNLESITLYRIGPIEVKKIPPNYTLVDTGIVSIDPGTPPVMTWKAGQKQAMGMCNRSPHLRVEVVKITLLFPAPHTQDVQCIFLDTHMCAAKVRRSFRPTSTDFRRTF